MSNWTNLKKRLKKAEKEVKEMNRAFEVVRTVAFSKNVKLNDIQEAILEEEYLKALRMEPLF